MVNFYELVVPTEEGDKTYYLLTQEGVENLLTPIEVGDLGELGSLLLTMQSAISEQAGKIAEQESKILDLEEKNHEHEEEETVLDKEINFIKENGLTAKEIAKRHNKYNTNKNGISTTEIYKYFGGTGNPKKIEMAEYIFEKINTI